jgi:prevent-host-death family protein
MIEVGAQEAETNLSALLDQVERGEEVRITRNGKPVARLVPNPALTTEQQAKGRAAATRIRAMAEARNTGPFDWEEWKTYRDEGKR